jgi:uncharacterized membrane protein YdjX (TVP38/TMEM64 family)
VQYPESVSVKGLAHIHIPAIHRTWGGVFLRFGMAIGLVAGLYLLFHYGLEPYMPAVDEYIRNLGAWGPVLFMLVVILGATLGFPESVLAVAAGAVFGIWWGFLWISIAGVIAAFLMFWIGRHLLRSKVDAYLKRHPKLNAVDAAVSDSGFRLIALLRFSPLNFTLLCYLMAVSRAKFAPYALASVCMLPGFLSTVYIGYAAKHSADLAQTYKSTGSLPPGDSITHEITVYGGMVLAVTVSVVIAKIAMKAIHDQSQVSE